MLNACVGPLSDLRPLAMSSTGGEAARLRAREDHERRKKREAAIRAKVKREMAAEASAARTKALEELEETRGTEADRSADMLGSALRMLAKELPARPKPTPRPAQDQANVTAAPSAAPAAETSTPLLTEVEQLSLRVLTENTARNKEMEQELNELAERRAVRKQALQPMRERMQPAGIPVAALPEDRAAKHASLFSWKPPPAAAPAPTPADDE